MICKSSKTLKQILILCIFTVKCFPAILSQTLHTKIHHSFDTQLNKTRCLILEQEIILKHPKFGNVIETEFHPASHPSYLDHDEPGKSPEVSQLLEIFAPHNFKADKISKEIAKHCDILQGLNPPQNRSQHLKINRISKTSKNIKNRILKLIDGGPSANRIDVVFMGDGYTEKERSKFFSDMDRLVNQTFFSSTFSEFLPLLNVWAIFTPSSETGISYPGRRRKTVFGLYRPTAGSLRGIYVRNKATARVTCRLVGISGCDFPILIGNDPYYGGLGGEFAISTSSPSSGSIVLRHELGHNFARVGEEYDGGEVYSGANSAPTLRSVPWISWLSNFSIPIREEKVAYRVLNFPGNNLDKTAYNYYFRSNGKFTGGGWFLGVTLAGAPEPDSVQFLLDGQPLQWKTSGTLDKTIYSWTNTTHPLTQGRHNLTIAATNKAVKPLVPPLPQEIRILRSLGSVVLYEFGNPSEFQLSPDIISAYPTLNFRGKKTFRPTANGCLMRNMTHDQLCSVCKESIWLRFLRRVSLIDDLHVEQGADNSTLIGLKVLPLGQFRTTGQLVAGERLEIRWTLNGKEQPEMRDKLRIRRLKSVGAWEVSVKLVTPRIRNDPRQVALDKRKFTIK